MLTTTMAKKNLNWEAKNVVKCQITGKLNTPNSPNSKVKKPNTGIFSDDNKITKNGKINDIKKVQFYLKTFFKLWNVENSSICLNSAQIIIVKLLWNMFIELKNI